MTDEEVKPQSQSQMMDGSVKRPRKVKEPGKRAWLKEMKEKVARGEYALPASATKEDIQEREERRAKHKLEELWAADPCNPKNRPAGVIPGRARLLKERFAKPERLEIVESMADPQTVIGMETWVDVLERYQREVLERSAESCENSAN